MTEVTQASASDFSDDELFAMVDPTAPSGLRARKGSVAALKALLAATSFTYDLSFQVEGLPAASEVVGRFPAVRAWSLSAGAPLSKAIAGIAATGSSTFTLAKNGASFGTIVFAASGTAGTFTVASTTSFAAGDVLTITAPSGQDATLANIGITLAGQRPA